MQEPAEAAHVAGGRRRQRALQSSGHAAGRPHVAALEQPGAHHRRQRERHHGRHDHGHRHGHGELAEETPDDVAHEQQRNEGGDQREGDRDDREADLAGAVEGGLDGTRTALVMADDVLQHDDRVVDDEADRDGQGHQAEIVEAVAEQVHRRQRAGDRQRQRRGRDRRRAQAAQEQQHDEKHQRGGEGNGVLRLVDRGADGRGAVVDDRDVDAGRHPSLQLRQHGAHAFGHLDDVGLIVLADVEQHGGLAIVPSGQPDILRPGADAGDGAELYRHAADDADNEVLIVLGAVELVARVNLVEPLAGADPAGRAGDVGGREGGADVVQREAHAGRLGGIDVDADRALLGAVDVHLADAGNLAQPLTDQPQRDVVDAAHRQRVGPRGEHDHGRARRVRLIGARRRRQVRRQIGGGGIDGGLHIAPGIVDVAVQAELQRDRGTVRAAVGRHLGYAGDDAEPLLQRRRNGARHGRGAGARQAGIDADGRKLDVRQRRHGKLEIGQRTGEQQAQHQQRGRDRPPDEGRRDVHGGSGGASSEGPAERPRLRRAASNMR